MTKNRQLAIQLEPVAELILGPLDALASLEYVLHGRPIAGSDIRVVAAP